MSLVRSYIFPLFFDSRLLRAAMWDVHMGSGGSSARPTLAMAPQLMKFCLFIFL